MLEQRRYIGLIARNAIERLGEYDVELAALGVLQQRSDTRPENDAGAGNGGIMIGTDNLPILPARMLTRDAELVLDRDHTLIVGRIAGVKRNLEHDVLSGSGLHIDSAICAAVKMHVFTGAPTLRPCPFCSWSPIVTCANEPSR